MKRLFLLGLITLITLKGISQGAAQCAFTIKKQSAIELSKVMTLETAVNEFETKFGFDEFSNLLNFIEENRNVTSYVQALRNTGNENKAKSSEYVFGMLHYSSLSFVKKGKLFTLTYEVVEKPSYFNGTRGLYLYRRDNDGWHKASCLILTGKYYENEYSLEFLLYPPNTNEFVLSSLKNDVVFIMLTSQIWTTGGNQEFEGYSRTKNNFLILYPRNDDTYRVNLFVPNINHELFALAPATIPKYEIIEKSDCEQLYIYTDSKVNPTRFVRFNMNESKMGGDFINGIGWTWKSTPDVFLNYVIEQ